MGRRTLAQEVELKFDIDPEGGAAIRRAGLFGPRRVRPKRQDSIYYDTADGALRHAGLSLRVRRSGRCFVQTVKRDGGNRAGLFVRQEWESEVPSFTPDLSVLDMLPLRQGLGAASSEKLVPLVRTRVSRTAWQVRHNDSWIEVALDEGSVTSGRTRAPVSELELELLNGVPDAVFDLAEEIAATAPLRLGVLSKIERGYALADGKLGGAAKAEPVDLTPSLSAGDAFLAVTQSCIRHFRLNETALLGTRNAEALHQARVAIRRLRSALSLFRPMIEGSEQRHFNAELRWLGRQLSDARNLDVLIGHAEQDAELSSALRSLRKEAYAHVESTFRAERGRGLMLKFVEWLELGSWRQGRQADRDLAALAGKRLGRQWRRIARDGEDVAGLDAEARHRLRIRIKKLRYATEFLASLYAEKPRSGRRDDFLDALKILQERLGDLNDAWTAEALAESLPEPLRPAIRKLHPVPDQQKALRSAGNALHKAHAAAGFWAG
ncbi:CHAD domain-containing protein [Sphingosinicella sp. LHD-64]|uniref:CYTH and CHAD domain-containing protein n=1 Tax=Sphingosinicella sp. LHD-64 TaxID=3072139 RepID=UPI00280D856C|nr:CHAD domain-containing protein [Sphingosinicella sp. LHD-64]MDQ8755205.1 CHAD domain-containing protein [Sphingosinicella sp. LHD-64]